MPANTEQNTDCQSHTKLPLFLLFRFIFFPCLTFNTHPNLEAKNWHVPKMQGDKKIYSQEEKQSEKALTRKVTRGISYKQQGRRRDRQSLEYRHLTTPPTIARGQHLLCLHLVCPILLEVMSRPNMKSWGWIHKEQGHGFHLSLRDEGKTEKRAKPTCSLKWSSGQWTRPSWRQDRCHCCWPPIKSPTFKSLELPLFSV